MVNTNSENSESTVDNIINEIKQKSEDGNNIKGALAMSTTYKYYGQYLTDFIAVELVIELFAGMDDLPVEDICNDVDKIHVSRGGLHKMFSNSSYHPVSKATYVLKRMGFASNQRRGYWSFNSVDDMIDRLESLKGS